MMMSSTVIDDDPPEVGAAEVLRRGLAASPELKAGLAITITMAVLSAAGRLMIPILIQQILDRGISADDGLRVGLVFGACALAVVIIGFVFVASRYTYIRLVRVAEAMLMGLRVRTFEHIHRLSLAEHGESRRGVLTARVTSDIETLAQFAQWGAIAWIVNGVVIVGSIAVMAWYSWLLTLVTLAVYGPMIPALMSLQRRQFRAYDRLRTRIAETLGAASEAVMGAAVVRAYGYQQPVRASLSDTNDRQFAMQVSAAKFFAWLAPLTDLFGALALSGVIAVGVWWGPYLGLTSGQLVAFLFLVTILLNPIAELGEVLDQTQTALAGWWKILQVLDTPVEVEEPDPGVELAREPHAIRTEGLEFAYRRGGLVLEGIDIEIPAGTNVAVVGQTGSGKTTFAKLLTRLADPTDGRVLIDGVDLRQLSSSSRHAAIRMVPQDGFLFDTTLGANVSYGRPGTTMAEVAASFERLGLGWWLERLPRGLDTEVGERGESLSVGERQLVALARAQLADPGILILDEATSAVDPETEQALADALDLLAEGRTTVSIAHRLSTAERADLVLVFDRGRLVEQGHHDQLSVARGRYQEMYESWVGNTRDRSPQTGVPGRVA